MITYIRANENNTQIIYRILLENKGRYLRSEYTMDAVYRYVLKNEVYLITDSETEDVYGYVSLNDTINSSADLAIYLFKKYHGNGIGKLAMNFIEKIAKNNGISVLHAATINADNLNFYINSGYILFEYDDISHTVPIFMLYKMLNNKGEKHE